METFKKQVRALEVLEYNNYTVTFEGEEMHVQNNQTGEGLTFTDLDELVDFADEQDQPENAFFHWQWN